MPKKRMPAAERRQESEITIAGPTLAVSYNWPDTGLVPGRESVLTWAGEPLQTNYRTAGTEGQVRHLMVNGPEDLLRVDLDTVGWDWIGWCSVEREVRRLRQRIFKASQEGDLAKARSLQKLMLRSRSNTLLSVRQVTQRNAGRKTAGIDGEVALTSGARADVAVRVRAPKHPDLETLRGQARVYSEGR